MYIYPCTTYTHTHTVKAQKTRRGEVCVYIHIYTFIYRYETSTCIYIYIHLYMHTRKHSQGTMDATRRDLLDSIGFPWRVHGKIDKGADGGAGTDREDGDGCVIWSSSGGRGFSARRLPLCKMGTETNGRVYGRKRCQVNLWIHRHTVICIDGMHFTDTFYFSIYIC